MTGPRHADTERQRPPRWLAGLAGARPFTLLVVAAMVGIASVPTGPRQTTEGQPGIPTGPSVVGIGTPGGADGGTVPNALPPPQIVLPDMAAHGVVQVAGSSGGQVPAAAGVPEVALAAYRRAASLLALTQPGCRLPVELLAAIGKVESGHARGGEVDLAGTARPPILGPVLNGSGGFATIADSDGGLLDGDRVWDRAVGPMQIIPSTWARWASDGNSDAVADPENLFDAGLAAARYLCANGRDLSTDTGLRAGILSYNNSAAYLQLVLAWFGAYRTSMSGVAAAADQQPTIQPAPQPVTAGPAVPPAPSPTTPPTTTRPPTTTGPATSGPTTPPPGQPGPLPPDPMLALQCLMADTTQTVTGLLGILGLPLPILAPPPVTTTPPTPAPTTDPTAPPQPVLTCPTTG